MPPPVRSVSCCLGFWRAALSHFWCRPARRCRRRGSVGGETGRKVRVRVRIPASDSEKRSWSNSLSALARVLDDAGLGKIEVLVEYQLPQTSKRADVVLCGTHPRTGKPSYVVAELKQRTRAATVRDTPELCSVPGLGTALQPVAGKGSTRVQSLFKYFNNFTAAKKNELDVLVADEAHRLRASSANRYTGAALRTGKSQVEELIDAARNA